MTGLRLSLALDGAGLVLPDDGRIAVLAPRADTNLAPLPQDRTDLITGFKPDIDRLGAQGWTCVSDMTGRYCAALICLPRAKTLARYLIAQAAQITDGPVIIDGAKTDGVDSLLKACRARVPVFGPVNKSHGKLFWFTAPADFADWQAQPGIVDGFHTAPGVFSADGIDPASRFLADHLPQNLGPHVADLGAGWGYLSARLLDRDTLQTLHLVEADQAALECARQNVTDPRARFHWADATTWRPDAGLDGVVMNPPFHTSRAADPDLGRAFIASAAKMLKPGGQLWLVANRHLGYESTLAEHFANTDEIAGDARFKILHGARPSRHRR